MRTFLYGIHCEAVQIFKPSIPLMTSYQPLTHNDKAVSGGIKIYSAPCGIQTLRGHPAEFSSCIQAYCTAFIAETKKTFPPGAIPLSCALFYDFTY